MKTLKKAEIKLRVSKQDKDKLKQLAKKHNESLSSYMLHKGLCTDTGHELLSMIPQQIDICSFFNEVYHQVEKYGSEKLKKEITEIYKEYILQQRKDA